MGDALHVVHAATEAFNAHDESRIRASYADGAVFTSPDGEFRGPDAISAYAMAWLNAFPDARITVENEFASGQWVASQFTFAGTHTETFVTPDGDVPATGKKVVGRAAEVFRIEDGKIAEEHLYFDQMQILGQLGLVPEGAAAA